MFKQIFLPWIPMSQRRSCSNSSFGSTRNQATNSSTASSKNASPSSSPHHSLANNEQMGTDCGQKNDKTIINICPFGHSPSTSKISPIPGSTSFSSSNNNSLVTDDENNRLMRLSSPLPSPSKLNPKGGRPSRLSTFSQFCPLLCSTRQQKSQQPVATTDNTTKKNSTSKNSRPQYSQAIQQIFTLTPSKSSQNASRHEEANANGNIFGGNNVAATTTTICCSCNCCIDSNKCEEKLQQITFSQRRRRRRQWEKRGGNAVKGNNGNGANNNNDGIWWRRNGKVKEVIWILLLQFAWVLPYLLFANYLERCLLPFRLHCYSDSDLLAVRRSPGQSPEFCSAQFFASNGEFRSPRRREEMFHSTPCPFNQTMAVLLEPWRIRMDEPTLKRVIVIRSAPRSLEYREFIRSSWKSRVELLAGPVIFVTGQDGTELAGENAQHGDILQLDFADSYRNLSLKMMGIYRFFTERSERIQQIVVINDDTIVNATALDQLFGKIETGGMPSMPADRRYLVGKVSRGYPRLVFPWLPWYVPAQLYPHKCYPPFVQGSSFIISREAAIEVLRRVCDFPWRHIHLDDILMGIATNCLGIANLHADGFDVGHGLDQFIVYHYQFSRHSANKLAGMFNDNRHNL